MVTPLCLDAEDIDGSPILTMIYVAQGSEMDASPSLRYITLLRDGARAHGLPEHYLRFWRTPSTPTNPRLQHFGRVCRRHRMFIPAAAKCFV
jgi:hypothetical protein